MNGAVSLFCSYAIDLWVSSIPFTLRLTSARVLLSPVKLRSHLHLLNKGLQEEQHEHGHNMLEYMEINHWTKNDTLITIKGIR
jgi:hypothetical protein